MQSAIAAECNLPGIIRKPAVFGVAGRVCQDTRCLCEAADSEGETVRIGTGMAMLTGYFGSVLRCGDDSMAADTTQGRPDGSLVCRSLLRDDRRGVLPALLKQLVVCGKLNPDRPAPN